MRAPHAKFAVILLCLGAWTVVAQAAAVQSHASIRAAARQFMLSQQQSRDGDNIHVRVGRLDSRLRLAACDKPLAASLPPGGHRVGNTSVGVRCDGRQPWRIYVQVRVSINRKVAVLAHAMARGEALAKDDLDWQERDISKLPFGYIGSPAGAVGKTLRQSVSGGHVLNPHLLNAALIVHRGQTVTLLAGGAALTVRMSGKALMDGARGDLIKVRNPHSHRVVQGTVVGRAQVRIGS